MKKHEKKDWMSGKNACCAVFVIVIFKVCKYNLDYSSIDTGLPTEDKTLNTI